MAFLRYFSFGTPRPLNSRRACFSSDRGGPGLGAGGFASDKVARWGLDAVMRRPFAWEPPDFGECGLQTVLCSRAPPTPSPGAPLLEPYSGASCRFGNSMR